MGLFEMACQHMSSSKFNQEASQNVECFRHATAMNEERNAFALPSLDRGSIHGIQAWFLGSHADVGGGTQYDGLALYPLQWMLLESYKLGLVMEKETVGSEEETGNFTGNLTAFGEMGMSTPWSFQYSNGATVKMRDIRPVHESIHPLLKYRHHEVQLSQIRDTGPSKPIKTPNRTVFKEGKLQGYSTEGLSSTIGFWNSN